MSDSARGQTATSGTFERICNLPFDWRVMTIYFAFLINYGVLGYVTQTGPANLRPASQSSLRNRFEP